MKRFNPEKELKKIQNNQTNNQISKTILLFIPILIIACCMITIFNSSYSAINVVSRPKYTIKIDIINGKENTYIKQVYSGPFKEKIESDATFGSINCTKGKLEYNAETNEIYSENITENIACVLSFMNNGTKQINISSLNSIKDNDGISYYYKGDATNNILKYKDELYRIVRINGNGTIRLMLIDSIKETNYGLNNDFASSSIPNLLNYWYENHFSNDERVITTMFDLNNYTTVNTNNLYISNNFAFYKVGLLSIKEVQLINNGISNSYIPANTLLINGYDLNEAWVANKHIPTYQNAEIHPVINLEYNTLKGQGSYEMPYEIED